MATRQFVYFLISGGLAAGLNWGSRFLFSKFFQFELAVFLAFLVGLISGFILMRLYVFGGGRPKQILPQIRRYVAVNLFALFQTLLISLVLARQVLPSIGMVVYVEATAHFFGVFAPVIFSFFAHKFFTFR